MTVYFGNGAGNAMTDRRYEMALQMAEWGDFDACIDLLYQCIELSPHWPPLYYYLGEALHRTNQLDAAKKSLEQYLKFDPEDKMGAIIKLSLIGAVPPLQSLPHAYVRCLFDQYAPKFDKCLVENLAYKGPEYLYRDITAIHPGSFDNVLDLGCGTGLAAALFHNKATRIVGVDLAAHMIHIAKTKKIYTTLHIGDMADYLQTNEEIYDLVLCADVLIYVGALEELFQLVAQCLSANGLFAFTVQATQGEAYSIGPDHRFSHSDLYIENCARFAGLTILSRTDDNALRLDNDVPVMATVFVCGKT